jgi:hypothetical protein
VRYRAKPFAVEVKRSNKRVPLTATTVDSIQGDRYRQADRLLFGGLSSLAEPVGPAGLTRGGSLSTEKADLKPQARAAEAVTSEIDVKAGRVRPTGRVLPDLLEQSRAEMRLRHELEEREVRLRAQRRASRPSLGSRPKRAKAQTSTEALAGRKAVLDPTLTSQVSLKQPVLAVNEEGTTATVEPVAASSPRPLHDPRQPISIPRRNTRRGAVQAGAHRSERQETSVLLRAGEKWKRRLPRVCW